MCSDKFFVKEKGIIAYCYYCCEPIYEGESFICINGRYYHYDKENRINNCYFPEEDE